MTVFTNDFLDLPNLPGAYVLILDLARPVILTLTRFKGLRLEPGRYAYAGSARGPGGIRARCKRHLRRDKKQHWHIDYLTTRTSRITVAAFPGGDECNLVETISKATPTGFPLPGFGSSDCSCCTSHLLHLTAQPEVTEIGLQSDDITLQAG